MTICTKLRADGNQVTRFVKRRMFDSLCPGGDGSPCPGEASSDANEVSRGNTIRGGVPHGRRRDRQPEMAAVEGQRLLAGGIPGGHGPAGALFADPAVLRVPGAVAFLRPDAVGGVRLLL